MQPAQCRSNRVLLSFVSALCMMCSASQAATTRPSRLDAIIKELRVRERQVLNIVVESESWDEECAANSDQWYRTPIAFAGTAWYNGLPGSKARIDVRKEIIKWSNGAAPYTEDSYSVAFDGKTPWMAQHSTGPLAKPSATRGGRISAEIVGMVFNTTRSYQTGAAFSSYFWNSPEKQSLADFLTAVLEKPARKPPSISVVDEDRDGIPSVRIEISGSTYLYRFWLDPKRGYALLGHYFDNHMGGQTWVISDDKVTQFVQPAPGIWYPSEAMHVHEHPDTGAKIRTHYRATKVVANSPDFDERIFGPDFPAGYTVEDKLAGTIYQVAPPKEKLEAELNRVVQEVASTTQKSGEGELTSGSSAAIAEQASTRSILPVIIFAIVAVLAVGCGAAILYRRRQSAKFVAGIAILLLTAGEGMGATTLPAQVLSPEGPMKLNCGVNTGVFAARYFRRVVGLERFGEMIQAGPGFQRDCSLLDLKRALARPSQI